MFTGCRDAYVKHIFVYFVLNVCQCSNPLGNNGAEAVVAKVELLPLRARAAMCTGEPVFKGCLHLCSKRTRRHLSMLVSKMWGVERAGYQKAVEQLAG